MSPYWVLGLVIIAGAVSAKHLPSSDRIVGGEPTTVEDYPSIVQMDFNIFSWSQSCAATIISARYVVSAAHCSHGLFYFGETSRRVRVGSSYRNTGGILHYFSAIYNHPSYPTNGYDGDISVGVLATPISLNPAAQASPIISQDSIMPDNTPVVHAGWGTTQSGGNPSSVLRDVTIYTVNNELCRQRYLEMPGSSASVTTNMICAGILDEGGKDACQGDSGGPLYYDDGQTQILVGVVSWGYGCAHAYWPGVSANVASYTNWILEIANNNV